MIVIWYQCMADVLGPSLAVIEASLVCVAGGTGAQVQLCCRPWSAV